MSDGDDYVINSGVEGYDQLDETALRKGAKLGFVFLSLPKGIVEKGTKKTIPSGHYVIQVSVKPETHSGDAQLLDRAGKVIATLPLKYETGANIELSDDGLSGGFGGGCVHVDYVGRGWRVVLSFCLK